jgi:hypothetical protein
MKKKEILEDLEIYVDPKPLTEEEGIALSLFIRQLKAKKAQRATRAKQTVSKKSRILQKL